jgi:hypothetical protein
MSNHRSLSMSQESACHEAFQREYLGGSIRPEPFPEGGLVAHWNENASALLIAQGSCGSPGHASELEVDEKEGHSDPS